MTQHRATLLPGLVAWLPALVTTACGGDPGTPTALADGGSPTALAATSGGSPRSPDLSTPATDAGPTGDGGGARARAAAPISPATRVATASVAGAGRSTSYRIALSAGTTRTVGHGASAVGSYHLRLSARGAAR